MKFLVFFTLLAVLASAAACDTSGKYIEAKGAIRYIDLEGGFWGIVADDGRKFDPINLPEKFKKDGLRVRGKLRPRDDLAGFHMWGQMVEIAEIRESK